LWFFFFFFMIVRDRKFIIKLKLGNHKNSGKNWTTD
jgi:hypothetical protein